MTIASELIFVGSALVLISIAASLVASRIGAPLLLVFLLLGLAAGREGIGGIAFTDIDAAALIGSLALAIILFDGGLKTKRTCFRVALAPAATLATLGVVLTAGLTGLAAWVMFDLPLAESLLIGAIVSPTDAAAVFFLLHLRGLQLKQRVGATLEVESGSNDPMAVFLTLALVEALAAPEAMSASALASTFALQMGLGAIFGVGAGLVAGPDHQPCTAGPRTVSAACRRRGVVHLRPCLPHRRQWLSGRLSDRSGDGQSAAERLSEHHAFSGRADLAGADHHVPDARPAGAALSTSCRRHSRNRAGPASDAGVPATVGVAVPAALWFLED